MFINIYIGHTIKNYHLINQIDISALLIRQSRVKGHVEIW